jgi:hypothetical protein
MGCYGDCGRGDGAYLRRDYHVVCQDLQPPTCSCRYEMTPEGGEVLKHALQAAGLVAGRSKSQPPACQRIKRCNKRTERGRTSSLKIMGKSKRGKSI